MTPLRSTIVPLDCFVSLSSWLVASSPTGPRDKVLHMKSFSPSIWAFCLMPSPLHFTLFFPLAPSRYILLVALAPSPFAFFRYFFLAPVTSTDLFRDRPVPMAGARFPVSPEGADRSFNVPHVPMFLILSDSMRFSQPETLILALRFPSQP